eukprot:scaffold3860_cov114-Isochrysis_galbana.AAC.2
MHTHGVRAIDTVRKPPMVLARCSTLMAFGPSANRSECHLLLRPAASSRVMRMASGIDEGPRMPCCASASTSVSHRRRDPGDTCIHIPASASCPLSNRCRRLRLRLVRLPPRCRGVFVANELCVLCSASTSAACDDRRGWREREEPGERRVVSCYYKVAPVCMNGAKTGRMRKDTLLSSGGLASPPLSPSTPTFPPSPIPRYRSPPARGPACACALTLHSTYVMRRADSWKHAEDTRASHAPAFEACRSHASPTDTTHIVCEDKEGPLLLTT